MSIYVAACKITTTNNRTTATREVNTHGRFTLAWGRMFCLEFFDPTELLYEPQIF